MEILDQITTQSPKALLALVLCLLGYWGKKSPAPNWCIPPALMLLGGAAYPVIAKLQDADYTAALLTTNVLVGVLIGGASVGLHQTIKHVMPFLFPNGDEKPTSKETPAE